MKTRKLIFLALLTGLAVIISLFESMIPIPIIVPGAKLGLSNIIILTTLIVFGFRSALTVSMLKSVLFMLVSGSVSSMFFSLAGAIFATCTMYVVYRFFSRIFSLIGVSIFGALAHNLGQLTVAVFIMKNPYIYTYASILVLTGLFTGFFVGLSASYVAPVLKRHVYREEN